MRQKDTLCCRDVEQLGKQANVRRKTEWLRGRAGRDGGGSKERGGRGAGVGGAGGGGGQCW